MSAVVAVLRLSGCAAPLIVGLAIGAGIRNARAVLDTLEAASLAITGPGLLELCGTLTGRGEAWSRSARILAF
jgi:hypothetical protein